jgi:hypothetical protein
MNRPIRALPFLVAIATAAQAQPGAAGPLQSGLQLVSAGKHDSAIVVFESLVSKGLPGTPRALQELFGLYVGMERSDDAYRVMSRARNSGVDLTALVLRPGVEKLKSDKRFAVLFPASVSFGDPFVEKPRIIHEWRGEKAGDEFGWIARPIGDVDGDRFSDVVVSATMNPPFGSTKGKLYV